MSQKFKFTCFKGIFNVHLFSLCIIFIEVTKGRCYPCIMFLKNNIYIYSNQLHKLDLETVYWVVISIIQNPVMMFAV